jgi:hypothetical protein
LAVAFDLAFRLDDVDGIRQRPRHDGSPPIEAS